MSKESIIYIIHIVVVIILLFKFIPRSKIREAVGAYLFKLELTWSLGLIVVELKLIEYPARLFMYANKTNFIFEFFLYPAICAIFVVNYPEKKKGLFKAMYYIFYCTVLTVAEIAEERYTNILKYIHWSGYVSWLTFFITFYASRKFNEWFFRKE